MIGHGSLSEELFAGGAEQGQVVLRWGAVRFDVAGSLFQCKREVAQLVGELLGEVCAEVGDAALQQGDALSSGEDVDLQPATDTTPVRVPGRHQHPPGRDGRPVGVQVAGLVGVVEDQQPVVAVLQLVQHELDRVRSGQLRR